MRTQQHQQQTKISKEEIRKARESIEIYKALTSTLACLTHFYDIAPYITFL